MRQISVLEWTRRLPFITFAIQCSDGVRYEIRNPELVIASMTHVAIANSLPKDESPLMVLSYYHIVRIEPLVPADGASHETENGQAAK